jgi:hypothetical protein
MRKHAKKKHDVSAPTCVQEQHKYSCHLQSWTKYSPKYWVVAESSSPTQHIAQLQMHPINEEECLTRAEDDEEEQRFDDEPGAVALDVELEHDENTN